MIKTVLAMTGVAAVAGASLVVAGYPAAATQKAASFRTATVRAAAPAEGRDAPTGQSCHSAGYEPVLNPANFVRGVTNPLFPLPVGRTLVYKGIKDGQTQVDTVHVTSATKVLEGIPAMTVTDVATHDGKVLEQTTDWYAQDKQGNVWYLGEDTTAFDSSGHPDHAGSWQAGVNDAEPGIVMQANPKVPNAYRQECLAGQAEDSAWTVITDGAFTVPYGALHHVMTSVEFSRIEPNVIDEKAYAPGIGVIFEEAAAGPTEFAKLVSVSG